MHTRVARSILLVTLMLASSACGFDRRKALAYDVLFAPDGSEREEIFYAALRARFPIGAQLRDLESFANGARGECTQRETGVTVCEIPVRGGYCWARLLRIEAQSQSGILTSVDFLLGGLGC